MLPDIDIRSLFGWYLVILVTTLIAMRGPPLAGGSELGYDSEKSKRSYSDRLFVNLSLVFVWPLILRDAIHDFVRLLFCLSARAFGLWLMRSRILVRSTLSRE